MTLCARKKQTEATDATMSDTRKADLTREEQESRLMASLSDVMEKAASADAPALEDFVEVDGDRFSDRVVEEVDEEDAPAASEEESTWMSRPSVKDQIVRYPESIRRVDPETKILQMKDPAQLAEYNRIQKQSSDPISPSLAIMECDRQPFEGSWVTLITYCKVQYRKL